MSETAPLPFWLVNVPREQWPAECPGFLGHLSEKDQFIIGTPDTEYKRLGWPKVREIVESGDVGRFHRVPSDLRKYRKFTFELERDYGSIMNFIVNERLQWQNMKPKGAPFQNPEDLKILYNDWPYGIDEDIAHLVIWTKFELEEDAVTGRITPMIAKEIDDYVQKTFASRVKPNHVIWFSNGRALKSVHAVEHFHVMLYQPDEAFVKEITNGDIPMSLKMG